MFYNHDDLNNKNNNADSVVSDKNGFIFSSVFIDTGRETQIVKAYANHSMLTLSTHDASSGV